MDWFAQLESYQRPNVQKKPWMEKVSLRLARESDLPAIEAALIAAKRYGFDTETTGLDQRPFLKENGKYETPDKVVGVCLAPSLTESWYLPIRHKDTDANIPARKVWEMLARVQASGAVAVFHNAKFDITMVEYDPMGVLDGWDVIDTWDCTYILAYLRNTRERNKGLKHLSKVELQREMIELDDLFEDKKSKKHKDFSSLDPNWEPVTWYAAADALNTLALYYILAPQVLDKDEFGNSQRTIYRIEKSCLRATQWMERCRIHIDRPKLEDLIRLGQRQWWDAVLEVYQEAEQVVQRDVRPHWLREMVRQGYDPNSLDPNYMEVRDAAFMGSQDDALPTIEKSVPRLDDPKKQETVNFPCRYDVTIPASLGQLLREAGVSGLQATSESGQVQTSKDVLDRVIEESGDDFPFMVKIKQFREVAKALGTNLYPIWWDTTPERSPDGTVWAAFNAFQADTGRFSTPTPSDKGRDGFHGQVRYSVHVTPATYDKTKPECSRRTRELFKAREGYLMFAIDFAGVELRIVTNLSGEAKWVNEFFRCSACSHTFARNECPPPFCPNCGSDNIGDLHTLTALSVFGSHIEGTSEFKQFRQKAKCVHSQTLLQLEDSKYCYIGDLKAGKGGEFAPVEQPFKVKSPEGWVGVKEVYNGAHKQVWHVVCTQGIVTCSNEHRFLRADGTLASLGSIHNEDALCVGDYLAPTTCGALTCTYPLDAAAYEAGVTADLRDHSYVIPKYVLENGDGAMVQYLSGLLDKDPGTITIEGLPLVLGPIIELLRHVGCHVTVGLFAQDEEGDFDLRTVSIRHQDLAIFHPYMKNQIVLLSGSEPEYSNENEVLEIVGGWLQPTRDLHVDSESHLYAPNGVVTHNSLNFAMCYGGGGSAAQRAAGVDKDEGWRIKNQFDKTYKTLHKWWESQHNIARKQKYVTTAFGRKYPLPDIDHTERFFRSKAERNSTNGPVQGTSADITKLAMALLYKEFVRRGWVQSRRVLMIITIHDELVFEIQEENAGEVVEVIEHIMTRETIKALGWQVFLKVDIEFGDNWTAKNNLIQMAYGKGGEWTDRWINAFPSYYAKYLKVKGQAPPNVPEQLPLVQPVVQPEPTPDLVKVERDGGVYVYRITNLTIEKAEKLARVIHRCIGKGVDTLSIRDNEDNLLLEEPIKVAYAEFRIVAEYEGL